MTRWRQVLVVVLTSMLALAAALSGEPAAAAPLTVRSTTVTVQDGSRTFSALLVQPTGEADGDYPVVGFGHGFAQTSRQYSSTLRSLASRGYIVIAPNTQTGLLPNHSQFATDLLAAVRWVQQTQPNADPDKDALVGHSMGGGAAVLAADRQPSIDAVATLAAAETRPSATASARRLQMPALFVVGTRDTVVRPATTRAMFEATPSPARWAAITGGYHCGFLDYASFFGIGCDSGAISRSTQLALTSTVLGDWLDSELKGAAPASVPAGVVVEDRRP